MASELKSLNSDQNLNRLWQESPVAELKPLLLDNQVYGSFEVIPDLTQIFSLNPSDDYEVDERTIAGWKLVYDTEKPLSAEYFSALSRLQPYVLDTKNDSILLNIPAVEDVLSLLTPSGTN